MTGSTPVAIFEAWNSFMSKALDFLQADNAKTVGITLDAHIHSQSWGYIIMIHLIIRSTIYSTRNKSLDE